MWVCVCVSTCACAFVCVWERELCSYQCVRVSPFFFCPVLCSLFLLVRVFVCVCACLAIGAQRRRSPSAVASEIFEPHLGSHILQVGNFKGWRFTLSEHIFWNTVLNAFGCRICVQIQPCCHRQLHNLACAHTYTHRHTYTHKYTHTLSSKTLIGFAFWWTFPVVFYIVASLNMMQNPYATCTQAHTHILFMLWTVLRLLHSHCTASIKPC